ncbi:hypothetical protein AJ79_08304 [Helicocarpus griseus UAMH5409]|uniref:Uncharacterized protein n=1 Tax=Helicocarpus griseus UAMH5409 TaxID=1447875 RepID=A0A2B7WUE0_9EURO|nr:hypothetical protein AJ79_08304 [Helicocarpus griseus UAMH5409]
MDPASAIGVVGGAIQITGLITKTIHGLYTLQGKYRNADITLTSLITQLSTIKAAVTQLHDLAQYNPNGTPKHPEYIDGLDVALDGCTAIMDVLSEEVAQLTQASSNYDPSQPLGLRAKMKAIWNEDLMRDHSDRLHAQVLALQLLLQACHCRTSSEQLELLRRQESRNLIKKVSDDTATLRSTISSTSSRINDAASSIRGSSTGDTVFEFDQVLVNEAPYRRAMQNSHPNPIRPTRPAALPARNNSRSTTTSATDEGYASGTTGTRTPNRSFSNYLSPMENGNLLSPRPYENMQAHDNILRSHSVSFGRTPSSSSKPSVERSKSTTSAPFQKSSGSKTEKLRSAMRRLNTVSRSNLRLPTSPMSSTSPTSTPVRQRKFRASESNISIDMTDMDSISAPSIVKAAQAGAIFEVENFVRNGADIEACHTVTGRNALAVATHCGKEDIVELLLHYNAKPDTRDAQLSTPLHLAASRGHSRVIQLLLEEDIEVELKDSCGRTPFLVAVNAGHAEAARILLEYNCKINARTTDQMTALHISSKNGDVETTSLLLRYGADIEAKDVNMMAAIHHACEKGHKAVVELLINYKANIEAPGALRKTPLICSAASGQFAVTEFLLRKKASPRSKDEHGMNALHWAAYQGHTEIVDLLLQKKVSVRLQNSAGRTPLHLATLNKQFAVVEYLLRKETPPLEVLCFQGFTPLHYACDASNIDFARLFLASGADIEAQVKGHQHRPIHIAAHRGSLELTQILCEKGAKVDEPDSAGIRALCIACASGNLEIAQQLLEFGAKSRIFLADRTLEDSPMCVASKAGHPSLVSLLLAHGSSAIEYDEFGWNPLLYAAHYGHPQVLAILLENCHLTADSSVVHMFDGGDSHSRSKERPVIKYSHAGILSDSSGRPAIPPTMLPNQTRYPWEPQDISYTPAYAIQSPPPVKRALPPAELPSTVIQGLPERLPREQGRSSPSILPQHDSSAILTESPLPSLVSHTSVSSNASSNLSNAVLRATALGYMANYMPNPTPSIIERENASSPHRQVDENMGTARADETAARDARPVAPEANPQSEASVDSSTTSQEPNDKDEDRDNEVDDSDADSMTTVFTAMENPEEELREQVEIFELEG